LTNYHNLYGKGQPVDPSMAFNFDVGKSKNADFAYGISATPVKLGKGNTTCEDYAVLNLKSCAGKEFGSVEIKPFTFDEIKYLEDHNVRIKSAGYPRTESLSTISVDDDCATFGQHASDSEALAHNCSSTKASSGSPIFSELRKKHKLGVFAMVSEVITINGAIDDNTYLTGSDATDPAFYNMAVPMSCIYDNIKEFLPNGIVAEASL
jgi:hypothetical protein